MYVIGASPYGGLFTKAQFRQGKGFNVGSRSAVIAPDGSTREFIAIKLGAATWLNGLAIIVDGGAAPGSVVTTVSGNPAPTQSGRIGILCFASATATQTLAGTGFGWAQIYGEALAFVSASVSTPGLALGAGASGQLIALVTTSASAVIEGIALATATAAAGGLTKVMLTYPKFQPFGA